jgi:hypothetical protein
VKQFLDEWFRAAGITSGKLFRCVCRSGTVMGRRDDRKSSLARRQDARPKIGDAETCSPRPPKIMRSILSRGWRYCLPDHSRHVRSLSPDWRRSCTVPRVTSVYCC